MTTLEELDNRIITISSKGFDEAKRVAKEHGIVIGKAHSEMSVETSKQFDAMDTRIVKLGEKVDALKDNFAELRTEMKVGFEKLPLLDDILKHAEYTNGKVAELSKWRERVIGMSQISVLVLLPILGWALYSVVTLKDTVRTVVADTLSTVELQVTK